jgi:hypothetical protein
MNTPFCVRHAALLTLCCAGAGAYAQDTPPITVTAAYSVENDQAQYPTVSTEDQIGKAELGLLFHTIQGLQKIEVDARFVNYQYQKDSAQNHTETNYTAGWQWAVTPRLRGNLDASQLETPTAGPGSSNNGPNRQTLNHYRADAEYEVDGPWHVVAGVNRDQNTSQYANSSTADSRNDSRDLGLRYDFATGSWIKFSVKAADGSYLNGANATDGSYQQQEQDVRTHWSVSTASSLDLYLTQIERTHQSTTQLDFNGLNYGASASWELSGRSTLVLGYAHSLAVVLLPFPLLTAQDSLSWGVNWQTSSRTQVHFRQALQKMDFRNPLQAGLGAHQDSSHDNSLTLVWTPGTQWQISAALQQQAHASNLPNQDYTTQQVRLSVQFSY